MKKIKFDRKVIALIVLIICVFIFYWFEIRPSHIRSLCDLIAWNKTKEIGGGTDHYDWKYSQCLHNKGLK